jgi:hypothetical protein
MKECYQCEKEVNYLFEDSRCLDCTRLTPEEVRGDFMENPPEPTEALRDLMKGEEFRVVCPVCKTKPVIAEGDWCDDCGEE